MIGYEYMLLPIGAEHPAAAHMFFNFFHRPDVYLSFMEWYTSIFVNEESWEMVDPVWLAERPWVELDPEYAAICDPSLPESFTGEGLELRTAIWEEVKAS
jgi:spermidine/putrescine-binding protein